MQILIITHQLLYLFLLRNLGNCLCGINYQIPLETVINHFQKFPLLTKKRADLKLLIMIVEKMKRKEHLTDEGLIKIVAIRASMNLGLSEKLKLAFPDVVPVERPLVELPQTIDPQ